MRKIFKKTNTVPVPTWNQYHPNQTTEIRLKREHWHGSHCKNSKIKGIFWVMTTIAILPFVQPFVKQMWQFSTPIQKNSWAYRVLVPIKSVDKQAECFLLWEAFQQASISEGPNTCFILSDPLNIRTEESKVRHRVSHGARTQWTMTLHR